MPTQDELQTLLAFPAESLSVEYKSWLNLEENAGKANLAKAAIAIANEGGGIIILGMREDVSNGGLLASLSRPTSIPRYHPDDVNAAIARFCEPVFHCDVAFVSSPVTGYEHVFVMVPGGSKVPIMSKRGCDNVISQQRCYVRKPGPKSEEALTAQEWNAVLERCLQARRESMLDAIRVILQGHSAPLAKDAVVDKLAAFSSEAQKRWLELVSSISPETPAKLNHGRYEVYFEIVDVPPCASLSDLRQRMSQAGQIKHTGWGPFVDLGREPIAPQPVDGNIEAWMGYEDFGTPAFSDFWRAHPSGLFCLIRGFDEDGTDEYVPGRAFELANPIRRIGEPLLYMARLARLFGGDPDILVECRYYGLANRTLTSGRGRTPLSFDRVCRDNFAVLSTRASPSQIDDNLVEIVQSLLKPLYEKFAFFEIAPQIVAQEIEKLAKARY